VRSADMQEKRAVERRRQQLEEEITNNKAREREYRLTLHDIASHQAHTQYLISLLTQDSKQRETFHTSLRSAESQLTTLQHQLSTHDESLSKTRAELLLLEQQLDHHQTNITSIQAKIPAMETEKNAAVAARDFKKAATASKEIKGLQQSKVESEGVLDELRVRVEGLGKELGGADEKKDGLMKEIGRLEEETDRKRLEFAMKREGKLKKRQNTATELLQKAYQEGRGGEDHLQKEVESVAVELQWTQVEIRELRGKYGWSEGDVTVSNEEEEEEEAEVVSHVDDPSPFDSIKGSGPVTNGLPSSTLGVPVIAPRKSSTVTAAPVKVSQADVDGLKVRLSEVQQRLTGYEGKLSEALESEEYEVADELNEQIAKAKDEVAGLEGKVTEMEKELSEEAGKVSEAVENKEPEQQFEEFAEED
jgi:chromosome segregation ATPase